MSDGGLLVEEGFMGADSIKTGMRQSIPNIVGRFDGLFPEGFGKVGLFEKGSGRVLEGAIFPFRNRIGGPGLRARRLS